MPNSLPDSVASVASSYLAGDNSNLLVLLQKCPPRINEEGAVEFICPTFKDAGRVMDHVSALAPKLANVSKGKVRLMVDGAPTFQFLPAAIMRYDRMISESGLSS